MDSLQTSLLFETGKSDDPLDEILFLASKISPNIDQDFLKQIHYDISSIFSGVYRGYKASNPLYHDLRHTHGVALATMRLFHGLTCDGHAIPPQLVQKGVISAYFHDSGLLLRDSDSAQSGAKFIQIHEDRSIQCLHDYLHDQGLTKDICHECATMIRFTNIELKMDLLEHASEFVKIGGKVLGSADILAQMADRYYLESLPLLFEEHKKGGLVQNKSASELISNTSKFYKNVIKIRLEETFDNVKKSMRTHFRERHNIDKDLYTEKIDNNIKYLEKILIACYKNIDCIQLHLRRTPPPS